MTEKLKPCPFCGRQAKVKKYPGGTYRVCCVNCPAEIGRSWFFKKEHAIAAWNRRANNDSRKGKSD